MAAAHHIPQASSFTWQLSAPPATGQEVQNPQLRGSYLQRRLLHWREGLLALGLAAASVSLWLYFLGRIF